MVAWLSVEHHRIGSVSDNHRVRIAQLSDLHLRDIGFAEERMFSSLQSLAPDIVLLTGDVVDRPESLAVLDTFLGHIQAPLKLAVLGNWEYWGSVDLVALGKLYDRHGVKLLVNACQKVAVGKSFVRIVGLDDFTAGRPDASKLDPACLGGEGSLILIQHFARILRIQPTTSRIPDSTAQSCRAYPRRPGITLWLCLLDTAREWGIQSWLVRFTLG